MQVAPPLLDDHEVDTIGAAALRVLLACVAAEPDPAERAAMVAILRRDGHLPAEGVAA